VWAALTGAVVIGSIANGMDLLSFSSSVKFMVTGVVLLSPSSSTRSAGRGPERGTRDESNRQRQRRRGSVVGSWDPPYGVRRPHS
jgi:hypothetical protein